MSSQKGKQPKSSLTATCMPNKSDPKLQYHVIGLLRYLKATFNVLCTLLIILFEARWYAVVKHSLVSKNSDNSFH